MNINNSKPYFCPLKREYYINISRNLQNCEIRPAGHRGWNRKNIYIGRRITFSLGYGRQNRTTKTITAVSEGADIVAFAGVPRWHIDAVEKIYGPQKRWLVAFVK